MTWSAVSHGTHGPHDIHSPTPCSLTPQLMPMSSAHSHLVTWAGRAGRQAATVSELADRGEQSTTTERRMTYRHAADAGRRSTVETKERDKTRGSRVSRTNAHEREARAVLVTEARHA